MSKLLDIKRYTSCSICKSHINYSTNFNHGELNELTEVDSIVILGEQKEQYYIKEDGSKGISHIAEVIVTCPNCGIKNKFNEVVCLE